MRGLLAAVLLALVVGSALIVGSARAGADPTTNTTCTSHGGGGDDGNGNGNGDSGSGGGNGGGNQGGNGGGNEGGSGHSEGALAFTGAPVARTLEVAAASVVGGSGLLLLARRRNRRPPLDGLGCLAVGLLALHALGTGHPVLSAADGSCPPSALPETPFAVLIPIAAVVLFGGGAVYLRRRSAR